MHFSFPSFPSNTLFLVFLSSLFFVQPNTPTLLTFLSLPFPSFHSNQTAPKKYCQLNYLVVINFFLAEGDRINIWYHAMLCAAGDDSDESPSQELDLVSWSLRRKRWSDACTRLYGGWKSQRQISRCAVSGQPVAYLNIS